MHVRVFATTLKDPYLNVKVKVHTLDIAPLRSESPPKKRSGMARVLTGSHSFTCTPTPQLVLIYRPRRDGRLSRPWREVAQADIQTRNLPIANPALYHTASSAHRQCCTWAWKHAVVLLHFSHICSIPIGLIRCVLVVLRQVVSTEIASPGAQSTAALTVQCQIIATSVVPRVQPWPPPPPPLRPPPQPPRPPQPRPRWRRPRATRKSVRVPRATSSRSVRQYRPKIATTTPTSAVPPATTTTLTLTVRSLYTVTSLYSVWLPVAHIDGTSALGP